MKSHSFLILLMFLPIFGMCSYAQDAEVITQNANLRGTLAPKGNGVEAFRLRTSREDVNKTGVWFPVRSVDHVGCIHGDAIKLIGNRPELSSSVKPNSDIGRVSKSFSSLISTKGFRSRYYNLNGNVEKTNIDRSPCT